MPPRLGTNTAQHSTQNTPPQRASMAPKHDTPMSHPAIAQKLASTHSCLCMADGTQMAPSKCQQWHPAMSPHPPPRSQATPLHLLLELRTPITISIFNTTLTLMSSDIQRLHQSTGRSSPGRADLTHRLLVWKYRATQRGAIRAAIRFLGRHGRDPSISMSEMLKVLNWTSDT